MKKDLRTMKAIVSFQDTNVTIRRYIPRPNEDVKDWACTADGTLDGKPFNFAAEMQERLLAIVGDAEFAGAVALHDDNSKLVKSVPFYSLIELTMLIERQALKMFKERFKK